MKTFRAFLQSMLVVLLIGLSCGAGQSQLTSKVMAPEVGLKLMAEGFTAPMEFISPGDGTGRMFLVDQIGVIKVMLANGTMLREPFLDISDKMVKLDRVMMNAAFLGLPSIQTSQTTDASSFFTALL